MGALIAGAFVALALLGACSPEAARTRDGGPGADPGNKDLVQVPRVDPRAADTTLWPGRAPAPVDRLSRGDVPPPSYPAPETAPGERGETPATPDTPPSEPQQRTFDHDPSADPRESSGGRE